MKRDGPAQDQAGAEAAQEVKGEEEGAQS